MKTSRRTFLRQGALLGTGALLFRPPARAAGPADDGAPITCGNRHRLFSKVLMEDRTVLVRVPDDHTGAGKELPVLYILDGEKSVFLHACSSADHLADWNDEVPAHIVVGIENTDRGRDMDPGNGADRFIEFIRTELIPWVEDRVRASGFRILAGQSASSIFALYSFLKRPGLFDAYICSSFGLRHSPGAASRLETELKGADLTNVKRTHLFITNGALDGYDPDGSRVKTGLEFLDALRHTAPPSTLQKYRVYEGEGHVPFPSIYDGLKWIHSRP